MRPLLLRLVLAAFLAVSLSACPGRVMNAATKRVAEGLEQALLNQNDLQTVRDGLPAYLLSIDGLINSSPDNPDMLAAGVRLYTTYAANFADDDPARAARLADRARNYAQRLLCMEQANVCAALEEPLDEFRVELKEAKNPMVLYAFGSAWATWTQTHSGDWNAVAQLPKIEAVMERVTRLDEKYDHGNAHLYLGVMSTLLPANLGGKPEAGKQHFERAIEISDGHNLMAKALYARHYARLIFDRPLHDRLVSEVLAAPAEHPGLTLSNTIAKQIAEKLQRGANDYF